MIFHDSSCINSYTYILTDSVNYTTCNSSNTDCQFIQNSQCNNDTQLCECQLGYTPEAADTSCRKHELGDPCSSSQACNVFIDNSTCDATTKQCVCLPAFKDVTITMYNSTTNSSLSSIQCELRQLGDQCTSGVQCSSAVTNSICIQTSQDTTQNAPSSTGDGGSNSTSNETTVTTTPVLVTTGAPVSTCSCAQGYQPANSNASCDCLFTYQDRCLPVKIDSTSCSSDSLCTTHVPNSECVNGMCTCKNGFASEQGGSVCQDMVLGASCQNDSFCSDKLSNTGCFNNICDCVSGYISNDNQTACVPCESIVLLLFNIICTFFTLLFQLLLLTP